jgi:hypothetical protein
MLRDHPHLKEIQTMIAGISSFKTSHTRRTGNMVAHICAKNASSIHCLGKQPAKLPC